MDKDRNFFKWLDKIVDVRNLKIKRKKKLKKKYLYKRIDNNVNNT